MTLYVHLLTWNGERYLPDFFSSFAVAKERAERAGHTVTLRVLDNGSTDGTIAYLRSQVPGSIVGNNSRNLGFAVGHNQLFDFTLRRHEDGEAWCMLANQDVVFAEECFVELAKATGQYPDVGGLQPKLLRIYAGDEGELPRRTDELDSAGLRILRGYSFEDRGQGQPAGTFAEGEVEGLNGALCVLRLSAARAVRYPDGDVLDGSFFSYKEDVDLSWRFQKKGLKMVYVPSVTAWHFRGVPGKAGRGFFRRYFDRRTRSSWRAAYGSRNQFLLLIKHLSWKDLPRHGLTVLFVESARLVYGLLFEPETRKLLLHSGEQFRQAWQRRGVY